MERTEPTLVPEWLKNAASPTGVTHSDDHTSSKLARNKSFVNINGPNSPRLSSDKTTSSYFRRSYSSNGSGHGSYSSFSRNQRDRERDKNDSFRSKEISPLGERRNSDFLSSKFERDGLRRSQTLIIGEDEDQWPMKAASGRLNSSNGFLTRGNHVQSGNKASFKRDVQRVPSPVLSTAIQSLPVGSSATIGGEKWTSALAEVPPVCVGSNGPGLNMAEAVANGQNHAQSTPQSSVGTHRLQELAIKQSRQLIPVTPSMPKLAVLTSDKHKPKVGPQQNIHPVSSSPRSGPGPLKNDASKASNVGKLQILKPVRERNENSSPTSGTKVSNPTLSTAPSVPNSVPEKRPTSQAKSRKDFFNLVRKKSMTNPSPVADSPKSSAEIEIITAPNTPKAGDDIDTPLSVTKHPSFDPIIPEEEEAAFLRSLGWEENAEEDGLTEEEINAFYRDVTKYINEKPTPNSQPKFLMPFNSRIGGISTRLSAPNAKLES